MLYITYLITYVNILVMREEMLLVSKMLLVNMDTLEICSALWPHPETHYAAVL